MRHQQRHVEKKRVGVMRRKVPSAFDLFDRRCVAAEIAVCEPREAPCQGQVRVQRNRTLVQSACFLGASVKEAAEMTNQRQSTGVTGVRV